MATQMHEAMETTRPEALHRGPSRWSQVLIVILVTLAALAAAGAYVRVRTIRYAATANVLVAPLSLSDPLAQGLPFIRESSDGSRPVQSAVGLIATPQIAAVTARRLGAGWTEAEVSGRVVITPRGESDLVAITAQGSTAQTAARLANTYARVALQQRREDVAPYVRNEIARLRAEIGASSAAIEGNLASNEDTLSRLNSVLKHGDPTLSMATIALPPTASTAKSRPLIGGVALIAGLFLGIGAAFFRTAIGRPTRI